MIEDLIASLEEKLRLEEARIERDIANHQVDEDYWKDLYKIREALRAAKRIREVLE